jgi:hypothetical protein
VHWLAKHWLAKHWLAKHWLVAMIPMQCHLLIVLIAAS